MDIKDYLHLYVGCPCRVLPNGHQGEIEPLTYKILEVFAAHEIRLQLRWLGNLSALEAAEYMELMNILTTPVTKVEVREIGEKGISGVLWRGDGNRSSFWYLYRYGATMEAWHYLIKKGFDIFGLIERDMADIHTLIR